MSIYELSSEELEVINNFRLLSPRNKCKVEYYTEEILRNQVFKNVGENIEKHKGLTYKNTHLRIIK